jgi:hypothetical protein
MPEKATSVLPIVKKQKKRTKDKCGPSNYDSLFGLPEAVSLIMRQSLLVSTVYL